MIKTLVFATVDSGRVIGEVRLQDGQLVADGPLQDLVDAHLESGDRRLTSLRRTTAGAMAM